MKKDNVKQIIQELAKENFSNYPELYKVKNGIATEEATTEAQELALSYFRERQEHEIERDEKLEVTQIDYVEWVMEAFGEWIENEVYNN